MSPIVKSKAFGARQRIGVIQRGRNCETQGNFKINLLRNDHTNEVASKNASNEAKS
jgi:hypothetical protein